MTAEIDRLYRLINKKVEQRFTAEGQAMIQTNPILSGTTFPASPALGDYFFRTDKGLLCRYNGTTWDSTGLLPIAAGGTGADLSATGAGLLQQASTGANVSVLGGTGLVKLTSGVPSVAAPVHARYYLSSNLSCANATSTRIQFNGAVYDPQSTITTGASWVFTAPRAGYYRFTANIFTAAITKVSDKQVTVRLYKNGSADTTLGGNFAATNNERIAFSSAATVLLASGDEVYLILYQNTGSTIIVDYIDSTFTYICIDELV